MRKPPAPRIGRFYGMPISSITAANGTWLEGEEFCYPSGRPLRRCYALCEDGEKRLIRCGLSDTYFSIPGSTRVKGKHVSGYITSDETSGFLFNENGSRGLTQGANRSIPLPNTSIIGYGRARAQIGDWIVYAESTYLVGEPDKLSVTHHRAARVIGFQEKDDKTLLVVLAVDSSLFHVYERWVSPEDVSECRALTSKSGSLLKWIMSPDLLTKFSRADLCQISRYGSLSDSYIGDAQRRLDARIVGQSLMSALRGDDKPMDDKGNILAVSTEEVSHALH